MRLLYILISVLSIAFPGIIVYLSHWFRTEDRARAFALFMLAVPISNVIGAPISGLLLGVHWAGIPGWRWLLLLEGLPAIALSAFARSEDRTRALRSGFVLHLAKPVEPAELVATVASAARRMGSRSPD